MSTEPDDDLESYPDTLSCPAGDVHFAGDAQSFLLHWVAKLGVEPDGAALMIGENGFITILHPETGDAMTPAQIVKAAKANKVRGVP